MSRENRPIGCSSSTKDPKEKMVDWLRETVDQFSIWSSLTAIK